MTRVRKLDAEDWDPELREMTHADEATPLEQGLMRIYAQVPDIAKGVIALGGSLKMARTLPERLVELVRLRIAFHNQCRSCMAIRYTDALNDGVDEELVCSLEDPPAADNLTPAEKAAIEYGDRFATNHLSIDDAMYARLREHFAEEQIIELGAIVAFFVGFGRLAATWDMTEELPEAFQDHSRPLTPWNEEHIVVR